MDCGIYISLQALGKSVLPGSTGLDSEADAKLCRLCKVRGRWVYLSLLYVGFSV